MKDKYLTIGLMSGTSFDGVNACLIYTNGEKLIDSGEFKPLYLEYPPKFKEKFFKTNFDIGAWEYFGNEITDYHIVAVQKLLSINNIKSSEVDFIAFHGQTIFHKPEDKVTVQIGNPAMLAQKTQINVITDFRRADVSLGGYGAPLVPIFHASLVSDNLKPIIFLNIGGVSNVTFIENSGFTASDLGPGCALIDDMTRKFYDVQYDIDGNIAINGNVNYEFVNILMQDKFFQEKWPKSLDRNYFKIEKLLNICHKPEDIIATLTYFTAKSIIEGIKKLEFNNIIFSGGGANNKYLIKTIIRELEKEKKLKLNVIPTSLFGINPDYIESAAFAYLAIRIFRKLPISFPTTTNVNKPVIGGGIYYF